MTTLTLSEAAGQLEHLAHRAFDGEIVFIEHEGKKLELRPQPTASEERERDDYSVPLRQEYVDAYDEEEIRLANELEGLNMPADKQFKAMELEP